MMNYVLLFVCVFLYFLSNIPSKMIPSYTLMVEGIRKFDNGADGNIALANCRHLQARILPFYIISHFMYGTTVIVISFVWVMIAIDLEWYIFAVIVAAFNVYCLFKLYLIAMDNWLAIKHMTYTMTKEYLRDPSKHDDEDKRHRETMKTAHDRLFDAEFHPLFTMAIFTLILSAIDLVVYLIKLWLS